MIATKRTRYLYTDGIVSLPLKEWKIWAKAEGYIIEATKQNRLGERIIIDFRQNIIKTLCPCELTVEKEY